MDQIAPLGPVYQAGTLSGNPLAMSAGIATLRLLREPGIYEKLEARSAILEEGIADAAHKAKIPLQINRVGSQMTFFFTAQKVKDYEGALKTNRDRFGKFFLGLLEEGVYLAPSPFEALFLSIAHSPSDINKTISAAYKVFKKL
jgi:glutamate-1-semialdehyde 2,1-aminomutase